MRDDNLQAIARDYLSRLRYMARKHGLDGWLTGVIRDNREKRCEATEKEVRMLAGLCDDMNVKRTDVPKILKRSYRYCVDQNIFERIRTNTVNRAIYDKVSVLLLSGKLNKRKRNDKSNNDIRL